MQARRYIEGVRREADHQPRIQPRRQPGQARGAVEPVLITDRGQPTHVLMSIADFRRFSGESDNILEILAMPEPAELESDDLSDGAWDHRERIE